MADQILRNQLLRGRLLVKSRPQTIYWQGKHVLEVNRYGGMKKRSRQLGNLIRQKRQARGLSQEQLAQQLEVSRQAVAKWESGKGFPSAERLLYLGQVLDIPAEALWPGRGKEGRPRHAGRIAHWLLAAGMAALWIGFGILCCVGGGRAMDWTLLWTFVNLSVLYLVLWGVALILHRIWKGGAKNRRARRKPGFLHSYIICTPHYVIFQIALGADLCYNTNTIYAMMRKEGTGDEGSFNLKERLREQRPASLGNAAGHSVVYGSGAFLMSRQTIRFGEEDALTAAMVNNYIKRRRGAQSGGKTLPRRAFGVSHHGVRAQAGAGGERRGAADRQRHGNPARAGKLRPLCAELSSALNSAADQLPEEMEEGELGENAMKFALLSYAFGLTCRRLTEIMRERKWRSMERKSRSGASGSGRTRLGRASRHEMAGALH